MKAYSRSEWRKLSPACRKILRAMYRSLRTTQHMEPGLASATVGFAVGAARFNDDQRWSR